MNLPNKLTIFRMILVPIMVVIPFFRNRWEIFRNTNRMDYNRYNFYNSINNR